MKTKPTIGQRVSYEGWLGPLTGTVVRIFPDFDEHTLRDNPFDPETWAASVKVDELPENWPYIGSDRFAPDIAELQPLEGAE